MEYLCLSGVAGIIHSFFLTLHSTGVLLYVPHHHHHHYYQRAGRRRGATLYHDMERVAYQPFLISLSRKKAHASHIAVNLVQLITLDVRPLPSIVNNEQ